MPVSSRCGALTTRWSRTRSLHQPRGRLSLPRGWLRTHAGSAQALGNMSKIAADQFAEMSAPLLRLTEARYLFDQFKSARNAEPNHGLFLLTVYFNSFLFCLVSIEEMVDTATRSKSVRATSFFLFFKALRNIMIHPQRLFRGQRGKFPRLISRIVSVGVGCSVELSVAITLPPDSESHIDTVATERPRETRTIEAAQSYLSILEAAGQKIMVVDLIQAVVSDVEPHVA